MKHLYFVISLVFINQLSFSQELVSTSGGSGSNSEVQISWSVGELVIMTYNQNNVFMTQGFHQTGYTISSIQDPSKINFNVEVFPNPATDWLKLEWEEFNQDIELRVFDASGNVKRILEIPLIMRAYDFDMSDYAVGTYLFTLFNKEGKVLKSIQVIKH